ncbi:hypothetical protein [Cytobacillus horneckiae]|uniref:hypothetical protein n=1 Tax=Cytobacillus horneckiae TaxID=549687 RepID=UPI003D19A87D
MKKYLSYILAMVLLLSTITPSLANASEVSNENELEDGYLSPDSDLVKFLEGVEQLPEEVIEQGIVKTSLWLSAQTGVKVIADGDNLIVPSLKEVAQITPEPTTDNPLPTPDSKADCVIAWGLMIGSVGFPFSKILKLKKAVSMLGGITKTVDKIYSKYKLYKSWNYRTTDAWKRAVKETGNTLSSDVRNAFLDFFNITNVIRACT